MDLWIEHFLWASLKADPHEFFAHDLFFFICVYLRFLFLFVSKRNNQTQIGFIQLINRLRCAGRCGNFGFKIG